VQAVASFDRGRQINPQWASDGSLFFLADPDGVTDVYRLDPAAGTVRQVTNLPTGISGITATSPALSVAAAAGTRSRSRRTRTAGT
jgi:Tol biopolymer transport system component